MSLSHMQKLLNKKLAEIMVEAVKKFEEEIKNIKKTPMCTSME